MKMKFPFSRNENPNSPKHDSPETDSSKPDAIESGNRISRRRFLGTTMGTALLTSLLPRSAAAEVRNGIPYHTLGNTGEHVSCIGLGGFHIGIQNDEQESIRIIRTALDEGINFLDNCWDYNDGQSEIRMGKALRDGYRKKAFLMSKIDGQTRSSAASQIDESLRRLQTDTIDLMQFHEVIREGDPDRILGPGGSAEAMLAAQKQGKIRYIGFTGHKSPDFHLKMLNAVFAHKFPLNTVQMPLNLFDAHFNSFAKKVLPVLVEHNLGVLGMKPMAEAAIPKSKTATGVECLHYAMSLPTSVVITGCDSLPVLQQALGAARNFKPLGREQMAALLAKTAQVAQNGDLERYKTSHDYDGTYQHPQWLG
jgi:predicted aldo/keto reductase-like oxidoreductase